jgi:hypothetical protein
VILRLAAVSVFVGAAPHRDRLLSYSVSLLCLELPLLSPFKVTLNPKSWLTNTEISC